MPLQETTNKRWSFTRKVRLAILLALGMVAVMTVLAFWSIASYEEDSNMISHTNRVIARLEELNALVTQAEAGQCGYLITQDTEYFQPYNAAVQAIPSKLTDLHQLTRNNPAQQNNLNSLQPLIQQRLDLLAQGVQLNQQQGFEAAQKFIQTHNGFVLMNQIQDDINAMISQENSLLAERSEEAQTGSTFTSMTFLMLAFMSAFLLLFLTYMTRQFSNDRRRAENKLTEEREFARQLLDLSPIGNLVIDTGHKVQVWNQALTKLTGTEASEMIGTGNHHQPFFKEDRPSLVDMVIDQNFSNIDTLYDEYKMQPNTSGGPGLSVKVARWFPNLNGKRRYVAFEANPIYNRDGTMRAAMTTFQDLTSYKKIEDALRGSEARFRMLMEKIPVGVTLNGPNGEMVLANETATELLGVSMDQLLGRTVFDQDWKCINEDGTDVPRDMRPTPLALRTKEPVRNKTQGVYRPKDNTWVWLLVNSQPLLDEEGNITNVITSFSDITARKEVEQLKTEFISVVSHELRTPLTSILGSLGLIMGGVAGEITAGTRAMLDIAHKNSERLVRLINDILDIEKIESGKMIFHLKPLELTPLVEQAIESTRSYAEQYGVRFECESAAASKHLKVTADPDRLTQVIVNLLSNAAKFSPRGEAVKIQVLTVDDKWVRLNVTDKGPGIPEEFKGRIFQKFAQADSSDTRQKGGTGLGLSISKAIVERFKGTINFTTKAGQGTTFYVDLPLLVEDTKNLPPAPPEKSLEVAPVIVVGPEKVARLKEILSLPEVNHSHKVLISEDEHDIAMFLFETFQHLGYECDIAYNATETRQLLANNSYALMTLDLLLPDEDGIKLLRDIRNQEKTRRMPVIVISGKATEGKIEFNGQALTIIDWLDKPVDQPRLLAAVKAATRAQPGEDDVPRILHIEDDPDLVKVIGTVLSNLAVVENAPTAREALYRLEHEKFDLILLDVELPDSNSASLPALLNNPALGKIPVVVFSGDEVDSVVSLKIAAGLIKSRTSNQELVNTIRGVFKTLEIPDRFGDLSH